LRDGDFHKNETVYLLKKRELVVFIRIKQDIFLEIVGDFD